MTTKFDIDFTYAFLHSNYIKLFINNLLIFIHLWLPASITCLCLQSMVNVAKILALIYGLNSLVEILVTNFSLIYVFSTTFWYILLYFVKPVDKFYANLYQNYFVYNKIYCKYFWSIISLRFSGDNFWLKSVPATFHSQAYVSL